MLALSSISLGAPPILENRAFGRRDLLKGSSFHRGPSSTLMYNRLIPLIIVTTMLTSPLTFLPSQLSSYSPTYSTAAFKNSASTSELVRWSPALPTDMA